VLGSVLEPVVGVELPKEVFTSRVRWMSLIVEWNASANMFYILKNLLLLIMVIFKLKCNNLIFNEIMVLNASYMCLHAFSLRWESPDPDSGRRTSHFWGGSVTNLLGVGNFVVLMPAWIMLPLVFFLSFDLLLLLLTVLLISARCQFKLYQKNLLEVIL
jgi:hypothetical protein